jgi:uncharacterized protein
MKRSLIALGYLLFVCFLLCVSCLAQNADEPASKDDVILYLRTMRSHDMLEKLMKVQMQSMEQLMRDQMKDKGAAPADYDAHLKKAMDDLVKNMPFDEIVEAMVPAYQKHFTHGDIEAMNAFYSSPVGQKVLEELPAVTQEGMQAAMPILMKYVKHWQDQMQNELGSGKKTTPTSSGSSTPTVQN